MIHIYLKYERNVVTIVSYPFVNDLNILICGRMLVAKVGSRNICVNAVEGIEDRVHDRSSGVPLVSSTITRK